MLSQRRQRPVQYRGSLPDIHSPILQNETELTRSTLVRISRNLGAYRSFFVNPQRFMDSVAAILKSELHQLIVDGIKYERIPQLIRVEWRQELFKNEELINYLTALASENQFTNTSFTTLRSNENSRRSLTSERTSGFS